MSGLVVATQPTSLVAVEDQCAAVEAWAETVESIPELRDASNKLAAINEYLTLTSTEGRARVAAAQRRLEVRIGVLLGPPNRGGDRKSDQFRRDEVDPSGLADTQRSEFRTMAANSEKVEEVIADSDDAAPASRTRVLDRIKGKKPTEEDVLKKLSRAAVQERVNKARTMASAGATSRQIAPAIGISPENFSNFKKRHGIEVPADAVVGKTHHHDNDRIVGETVSALEGLAMGVGLLGDDLAAAGLDPDQVEGWTTSLYGSLTTLNNFRKQLNKLKEMTK